jgi:hypothetical protein
VPKEVQVSFLLWLTAVAAGVLETIIRVIDALLMGSTSGSGGEADVTGAISSVVIRVIVYTLVVYVITQMRLGRRWARLTLAVLLGVIGTLSLVIDPILWLAGGNPLREVFTGADLLFILIAPIRSVHLAASIPKCSFLWAEELRTRRTVAGHLVSEGDVHGRGVRCVWRRASTGASLDRVRFIELIEDEEARLSPEGRALWEELEFLRESIPDPTDESRMAHEYEIMERIFELPMHEQFVTSRLAELVAALRRSEEAESRGEPGEKHRVRGVINAVMLKDEEEGRTVDPKMTLELAIARLKE